MALRTDLTGERRAEMRRRAVAVARHDRAVHHRRAERTEPVATFTRKGTRCKELNRGFVKRGLEMARVLASPIIPLEASEARMAHCRVCEHATVTKRRNVETSKRRNDESPSAQSPIPNPQSAIEEEHFCQCCGCPRWRAFGEGSALEFKTRHAGFECPREPPAFGPCGL